MQYSFGVIEFMFRIIKLESFNYFLWWDRIKWIYNDKSLFILNLGLAHKHLTCVLCYLFMLNLNPSGYIGEDPRGIPNNLMPFVQQVAVSKRPALTVFGTDYSTKDGTGVSLS